MKRRRNDLYMMAAVIGAVLVIIVGAIILLTSGKNKEGEQAPTVTVESTQSSENGTSEQIEVKEEQKDENAPEIQPIDEASEREQFADDPTHLFYNADATDGYLNHCIFLGDSRTVAAKDYAYVNDSDALCQVGINHLAFMTNVFQMCNGEQINLDTFLGKYAAEVIYISLGVNGINSIDDTTYRNGYKRLVEHVKKACPGSIIVLEAIWPVEDTGLYSYAVKNADVDKYNEFLHELAGEEGCYYLNIDSVLKDADGTMINRFDGGDGLHYSKSSYDTIFDYIIHHPVPGIDTTGKYVVNFLPPIKKEIDPADGFAAVDGEEYGDDESSESAGGGATEDDEPAPGEDLGMDLVSRIHAYGISSGNLDDGTELFLYDNKLYTSDGRLYLDITTSTFGPGFEYLADENYSSDDSGDSENYDYSEDYSGE